MTLTAILADIYRRTGYATSPASDVVTRITAFVNEVQRELLSEPGMEYLLNDSVTFGSVADQATYGLTPAVARIKTIREATNRIKLYAMSLSDYRELYPDTATVTGTPTRFCDLGFDAVQVEPSDASTIFVISTSGSDTGTAYIEGYRSGGIPFTASVTMTGATAVSFTPTDVIGITKFYLSAAVTAGATLTLREDSGTGTVLAQIPPGATNSRYRRIALIPTPSAAITYTIDFERNLTDLVNGTDESFLPEKFHRILATGARAKEYEKLERIQKWQIAIKEYETQVKKLKFWLRQQSAGNPNLRGAAISQPSILEGGGIAAASSSSTPLVATSGGTGFSSYTVGDMLYADTTTSLAKLTAVAAGRVLRATGASAAPAYSTFTIPTTFATGDLVHASATNTLTALAAVAAGRVLRAAGAATAPAYSTFTIPDTFAQGDVLFCDSTNVLAGLAKDANATRYLSNQGTDNDPSWNQVNLANGVTGDLPFANLTQGSALSVLGVTGNATADNASIAAGSDHQVLRRSGTAVAFGAIQLAQAAAVAGVLPTANGGTSVDIASAALPLASGQITFPATQNASGTVNVLDDYEEGTWSPVIGGATSESGQTYSNQTGEYVKVGKLVVAWFTVQLSAEGTITGNGRLKGLPFTSDATAGLEGFGGMCIFQVLATNWITVNFIVPASATAANILGIQAAAANNVVALTSADFADTTYLSGCIVYEASA